MRSYTPDSRAPIENRSERELSAIWFWIITALIVFNLGYMVSLFYVSRFRRPLQARAGDDLVFVFVMPCLNEERVLGASLDRLLRLRGARTEILVVDDGSEDETAAIVEAYAERGVHLLRRVPPDARLGKGAVLNAAYEWLCHSEIAAEHRREDIVVCVVDADGRLEPNCLIAVAPYFEDERVGAVQIGVRIDNRAGWLPLMQDVEFVLYTELFQRGRENVGSVGMGGNGQFSRLSVLDTMQPAPWNDVLTEDLDLGVRILLDGYDNRYCPTTHVNQQGVTTWRRLLRQRARWFHGYLQCEYLLPRIVRSERAVREKNDLAYVLVGPFVILATAIVVGAFLYFLSIEIFVNHERFIDWLTVDYGLLAIVFYLLAFTPALLAAYVYWTVTPDVGIWRSLGYGHVYVVYSYMWIIAGAIGTWHQISRRRKWSKTDRSAPVEAPVEHERGLRSEHGSEAA